MAPLGPFEPAPRVAVAVSGGANSLCLALLVRNWAAARGGRVTGLVVDHGLRPGSAAEAALTLDRLAGLGIDGRLLRLDGLAIGPALAERARTARHAALEGACAAAGIVHLLFGHHAADQAETVAMRRRRPGGAAGLAGIGIVSESALVRRLRPLLPVPPGRLRATLRAAGLGWIEDPSNADPRAERNRLRRDWADPDGDGPDVRGMTELANRHGTARTASDAADAAWLAGHAELDPAGFAVVAAESARPGAIAGLLRAIGGRTHPPPADAVAAWVARPAAKTLAGVRILPAGRRRPGGWLFVREAAAVAPPAPCADGMVWDDRFRVIAGRLPPGLAIGALGRDAATLRDRTDMPAAALWPLPALRCAQTLFAVPHIGYGEGLNAFAARIMFDPKVPARGAPFLPGGQ